jgi:putative flippase GtrA
MKWRSLHQGIRFVLVGGLNTAFSYVVYAACIFIGGGYVLASAASMAGGILFSHMTTGRLVFAGASPGSLARFAACYLLVYGFNLLLLYSLDRLGVDPYLSGLIVALPGALLSFVLLKLVVFRTRSA